MFGPHHFPALPGMSYSAIANRRGCLGLQSSDGISDGRRKELLKKLHKTIKKGAFTASVSLLPGNNGRTASKQRQVKRGVKEVVKGIRKGEKG